LEWLNHPDQPITKDTVKEIQREIKTASNENPEQFEQDLTVLRKEVKYLLKTFKDQKRSQKQQRRVDKRAKRAARKLQRKARRDAKKGQRKVWKDEKKCKGKEFHRGPPWARSRDHLPMPASTMPVQHPATPPIPRGFPFGRAASVPFIKPPFMRPPDPPGTSAMHGGWPFTQGIPVPPMPGSYPSPVSHSAENLHTQAVQMDTAAERKETRAMYVNPQTL
jgi:hypothetical protein